MGDFLRSVWLAKGSHMLATAHTAGGGDPRARDKAAGLLRARSLRRQKSAAALPRALTARTVEDLWNDIQAELAGEGEAAEGGGASVEGTRGRGKGSKRRGKGSSKSGKWGEPGDGEEASCGVGSSARREGEGGAAGGDKGELGGQQRGGGKGGGGEAWDNQGGRTGGWGAWGRMAAVLTQLFPHSPHFPPPPPSALSAGPSACRPPKGHWQLQHRRHGVVMHTPTTGCTRSSTHTPPTRPSPSALSCLGLHPRATDTLARQRRAITRAPVAAEATVPSSVRPAHSSSLPSSLPLLLLRMGAMLMAAVVGGAAGTGGEGGRWRQREINGQVMVGRRCWGR
ncbi:unnamed protein product [Closterium sp. Naga37s-1]|nr:unnamed protein product [Closterium sp. Naga37s-1]